MTIPRAELMACLIAARLTNKVKKDLEMSDLETHYWTDSTTALSWIKRTDTVWSVFVNNRVLEIRRLSAVASWHHVSGERNPADHPSRGISVDKYLNLRWWEGPGWLHQQDFSLPIATWEPEDEDEVIAEKRKSVVVALNKSQKRTPCFLDSLVKYGDWHRIVSIVAYLRRFARNASSTHSTRDVGVLTVPELDVAEAVLLRYIQETTFGEKTPSGSFILEADEHHVKRIVTRLFGDNEFARPAVLPGSHPLVELLIRKVHSSACHARLQATLSLLREKYWIVNSRRAVRRVINTCAICRVHTVRRCKVIEAPLPVDRTFTGKCFGVTGVDLAGPLYLKNGDKLWVVIFTCAVYRAVHLEHVLSLSTEAFIGALKKFVARRGRPGTIYSDNGTNFVGCANLLRVNFGLVARDAALSRIQWKFNPPSAAWWGGWWERLIGLMKQLMRKILGKRAVTLPEMEILIVEVEAVMNERPFTYISEDPNDLRPLTPSMFLKDLPIGGLPEFGGGAEGLQKAHRKLHVLRDALKSRFKQEYLGQLVHYAKSRKTDILMPGDVVLLEMENKKRIEWPMGILLDVYPGRDGVVRSARIRTTHGETTRPLQRLFPLEVRKHTDGSPNLKGKDTACDGLVKLEEDSETEEDPNVPLPEEPEPIITTKSGRKIVKPDRFAPSS